MCTKIKTIFVYLAFIILYGCSITRVNSQPVEPPTKSFVKILLTANVISCTDEKDPKCPKGEMILSGSGMAVSLVNNKMTVLTAGHVCDIRPTKKIKEITQVVHVIDHTGTVHQAWPILITHNNQVGSADLCLLWVPTLSVKKIKFSKRPPKIGEELTYIGAPKGIYHPPTVPIFKGIYSGLIDASSALLTAPATGGASGAAVLNKENKIVGVLWGTKRGFNNVAIITSYKSLYEFLELGREIISSESK